MDVFSPTCDPSPPCSDTSSGNASSGTLPRDVAPHHARSASANLACRSLSRPEIVLLVSPRTCERHATPVQTQGNGRRSIVTKESKELKDAKEPETPELAVTKLQPLIRQMRYSCREICWRCILPCSTSANNSRNNSPVQLQRRGSLSMDESSPKASCATSPYFFNEKYACVLVEGLGSMLVTELKIQALQARLAGSSASSSPKAKEPASKASEPPYLLLGCSTAINLQRDKLEQFQAWGFHAVFEPGCIFRSAFQETLATFREEATANAAAVDLVHINVRGEKRILKKTVSTGSEQHHHHHDHATTGTGAAAAASCTF